VIGSTVKVRGVAFTVVGVTNEQFSGTDVNAVDAWIPLAAMPVVRPKDRVSRTALARSDECCLGIGARLAAGVDATAAASELSGLVAQVARPGIDTLQRTVVALPFTLVSSAGPQAVDEVGPVFMLIGGGVFAVLLLACANVANLLLARATARQREISIRLALGASRPRLVRQLMTESLLLALLAGIPALAIAMWLPRWIIRVFTPWPVTLNFVPDARVMLFTLGLAAASCVLFGLAPALQVTRPPSAQRVRLPLRSVFLSAQVIFCVVLLVSAGLFLRSANGRRDLDIGFATDDVTELTLTVPANEDEAARGARLSGDLPDLSVASGVKRVAYAQTSVFRNLGVSYRVSGQVEVQSAAVASVTPEYFDVVSLPLLSGRVFRPSPAGANEILVNAELAERLGGVGTAIGRTLTIDSVPRTIVGIVRTTHDAGLRRAERVIYRAFDWTSAPRVVIRGDAADGRRLAAAISERDPSIMVASRLYSWYVNDALSTANGAAAMAGSLGILALLLASVGMFGVFSYWVRQRQHDIGVRMALGATPASVVRMVLRASAKAVGWGLVIGILVAVAAAQLLRSSLYGLSPLDPPAFGSAIGILLLTALIATLMPAWRAVKVDPLEALRAD
jgi:predicted permease